MQQMFKIQMKLFFRENEIWVKMLNNIWEIVH